MGRVAHAQDPETQGTFPIGPTGRVHRGGRTTSKIPDNKKFWESVNAVDFTSRGSSRREVYRAVAYFVSLTDARVCFASVETQAKRASLGTTATRSHLRALERDGYLEVEGERSGGRSCTRYRLTDKGQINQTTPTLTVAHPDVDRLPTPTLSVAHPNAYRCRSS